MGFKYGRRRSGAGLGASLSHLPHTKQVQTAEHVTSALPPQCGGRARQLLVRLQETSQQQPPDFLHGCSVHAFRCSALARLCPDKRCTAQLLGDGRRDLSAVSNLALLVIFPSGGRRPAQPVWEYVNLLRKLCRSL